MNRALELIVAGVCAAISFPRIGFKPQRRALGLRWFPIPPDQAELDAEQGSWFHLKKDLWVNSVRADAEWWGKLLAHVIACQFVMFCVLIYLLLREAT